MATTQKRGNGYKITVSCGYDLNGKQIRKTTTWAPDDGMTTRQIEKELERQKVLFEEKCRSGQVLDGNIRFADFVDRWFTDYAEKQLRPTTLRSYKQISTRINAAIGHIHLDKLQPHHILTFYNNLSELTVENADTMKACVPDLKQRVKAIGHTQTAFAKMAGIATITLQGAYTGKHVTKAVAAKIASALHEKVDTLFEPAREPRPVTPATVRKYHAVLSSILSTAVKMQVILSNPCDRVPLPKLTPKQAVYLDEKQAVELLGLLEQENMQRRTIVTLLLFSGMRRGELCGLEWSDIDFEHALVHVNRSSLYLPERGVFQDDTKTQSSIRAVKLPDSVLSLLRSYRAYQLQERLKLGDQWHDSNRLFTKWNGEPIHPDTITKWFCSFIAKTSLPQIHVHSLRHTNATLQIAAGVPLSAVADRLGHASPSTTSKVYTHAIQSANAAAADVLETMLHPVQKQA